MICKLLSNDKLYFSKSRLQEDQVGLYEILHKRFLYFPQLFDSLFQGYFSLLYWKIG